jgi:hypothetical protein
MAVQRAFAGVMCAFGIAIGEIYGKTLVCTHQASDCRRKARSFAMTSRRIRVQVPAPVAVPRAALWIGQLLDWAAARVKRSASLGLADRYATEGGK